MPLSRKAVLAGARALAGEYLTAAAPTLAAIGFERTTDDMVGQYLHQVHVVLAAIKDPPQSTGSDDVFEPSVHCPRSSKGPARTEH
jgi:hypothetical protein